MRDPLRVIGLLLATCQLAALTALPCPILDVRAPGPSTTTISQLCECGCTDFAPARPAGVQLATTVPEHGEDLFSPPPVWRPFPEPALRVPGPLSSPVDHVPIRALS